MISWWGAVMTTTAGSSFEEDRILEEESWQPERGGRGVLYFIGRREGPSERGDEKVIKSRKGVKEGTVGAPLILGPGWRCMLWSRSG